MAFRRIFPVRRFCSRDCFNAARGGELFLQCEDQIVRCVDGFNNFVLFFWFWQRNEELAQRPGTQIEVAGGCVR